MEDKREAFITPEGFVITPADETKKRQTDEQQEEMRRNMYSRQVVDGKFRMGPHTKFKSGKIEELTTCLHPYDAPY